MPDFIELAKNGNANAIEVLMNRSFGSQGVVVSVTSIESTLKVTLKTPGEPGPDKRLAARVKTGLSKISPKGFDGAVIEGKIMKTNKLVWSIQWGFEFAEKKPQVVQSQQPGRTKKAGSFEMDINLEGSRKWVTFALLGIIAIMAVGWWWVIDSNTPKASRIEAVQPAAPSPTSVPPKEPPATQEEVDAFRELVSTADPEQIAITQVQQYEDTELLYLTVGQGFIFDNQVNQGDLAIRHLQNINSDKKSW